VPLESVIEFKLHVYQQALLELARLVFRDPCSRYGPPDWQIKSGDLAVPGSLD
jgi:hypothetical protein